MLTGVSAVPSVVRMLSIAESHEHGISIDLARVSRRVSVAAWPIDRRSLFVVCLERGAGVCHSLEKGV